MSSPEPVCEVDTGQSLYWQDVCGGGYRHDGILFHDSVRPKWYASSESVMLFRDENTPNEIRPVVPDGTLDVGSDDLDAEFENNVRVLLGHSLGDWYRVEGLWQGFYEWNDTLAAQTEDEEESMEFRSTMNNAELNLRRRVRILDWPKYYGEMEFSTMLGLRYFSTDESFEYRAESPTATNRANVSVGNEMFGAQVGSLAQWLFEDRGWLDIELKGALLSNQIDVESFHRPNPGPNNTFVVMNSDNFPGRLVA